MCAKPNTAQTGMTVGAVAAGLRAHDVTPILQWICTAGSLLREQRHISAEQLPCEVNGVARVRVSKTTVFNTSRLFAERGLVREIIADPTKVFHDSIAHLHHRFHRSQMGVPADIPADQIRLDGSPELPPGTEAVGVEVIVRSRPAPAERR